ncbi:MAG: metal-sulfur cluster assembly factor [Thermodesulfobacteriota bacterium]
MGLGNMISKIFKKEGDEEGGLDSPLENSVAEEKSNPVVSNMEQNSAVASDFNETSEDSSHPLEHPQDLISKSDASKSETVTEAKILEVLGDVYDPEIPIDIVNLGLIYGIEIQDGKVHIRMTMTAPGCPASGEIIAESKLLIEELPGVKSANIEVVWDPPWDPSRMSEEAKQSMGF